MSSLAYVVLPVLDEVDLLPRLLDGFAAQTRQSFELWACVNQPESWWNDSAKRETCDRNQMCLRLLEGEVRFPVRVLDRASPGTGWTDRRQGVGWARRTLMDAVSAEGHPESLIVSIDADTEYPPDYLERVAGVLEDASTYVGVAAPYLHARCGNDGVDRAMLRYEIYLRVYALNLWRFGSPYAFTAMGSLISTRVRCYRAVGGLEPKRGGEDFYFLQKLCKHGRVAHWVDVEVKPATRISQRVPIGTGPALAMDLEAQRQRYPIYPYELFEDVRETTELFADLYSLDQQTPMTTFLKKQLSTNDLWGSMRDNYQKRDQFVRACHDRVDGLRILQYVKSSFDPSSASDEANLRGFLDHVYPDDPDRPAWASGGSWTFASVSVDELDTLRHYLKSKEDAWRRGSAYESPS